MDAKDRWLSRAVSPQCSYCHSVVEGDTAMYPDENEAWRTNTGRRRAVTSSVCDMFQNWQAIDGKTSRIPFSSTETQKNRGDYYRQSRGWGQNIHRATDKGRGETKGAMKMWSRAIRCGHNNEEMWKKRWGGQ